MQETMFFQGRVDVKVASCIAKMKMVDLYYDSTYKSNEASVRIKDANNIAIMLCAVHNHTFRVEERLIHPKVDTLKLTWEILFQPEVLQITRAP